MSQKRTEDVKKMDGESAGALVAKLRAAGMDVWLEDGEIRGRWRAGGRAPYGVAVMLADLRDMGMVAVDFLQHEASAVNPAVEATKAGNASDDEPALADQRVINGTLDNPGGFDQIRAASPVVLPEPDADGIVRLVRVSPEVAFAAGDLINDGKAELIGNVIYRRLSNVFDVTYRVFES